MAVGEVNPSSAAVPGHHRPTAEPHGAAFGPGPADGRMGGANGGPPADPAGDVRFRERTRALVCCLALAALAFATRPGAILADTKIDMAVQPGGFLGRALHLWDPEQFGQLQNQAVGYLFPMGPFHLLGDLAGLPAWITQRLWLTALMCLAFLGARRLAARLGVGGPTSRLVGAMAYTLAPGGLATLGQISSEYLPVAMLPWIVLPLVTAVEGGGRARAAARSGIAIALCGGINATATIAVLTVPVLYVLTRPRAAPRVRTLAWWSGAAGLATLWWLVPLLLTGTYGFSWLTYTEKADTTTGPTGLVNTLRGAERWVNYLNVDGQAWWPVGHALSVSPVPMVCTGVVAALGVAGLLRRLLPERSFLLLTLLAGLVIISAGHLSDVPGLFSGQVRELLDGALAPLRNVHKFDAVVRLPLAFGLAHLLTSVQAGAPVRHGPAGPSRPRRALLVPAATLLGLGGIAGTAASNGLTGPGVFQEVPSYWRDAASWLNARAGQQGVLALPGAAFGEYTWGRPMDDIVQPLLSVRWGVRQLVPAGSPGYTRALDAIDQQVRSGTASPGMSAFLGRMGVRYLLVRNDLRRETLRGAWPARLHQALGSSPGLRRVAVFGGPVGGDLTDDAVSGLDQPSPALEIYEVAGADDVVDMADATSPVRVYGGPESLLSMADGKALPRGPVLLNDDSPELGGAPVVSDSTRLLRRNFGELHQTSPTLADADRAKAADVLDEGWEKYTTSATYGGGVRNVTASSSAAGADAIPQARQTAATPYAALDGNRFTAWETGGWTGPVGQWLKVDFDRPRELSRLSASFVKNEKVGPPIARVAVETEAGTVAQAVRPDAAAQELRVPSGETRWVRVRILGLTKEPPVIAWARAGIAELSIDGVKPARTFTLPTPKTAKDAAYVMSRASGTASDCMKGARRWVCAPSLGSADEEGDGLDRTFTAKAARNVPLTGTAVLTDPALIERYTTFGNTTRVAAGSTITEHPAAQARSGFDGDPETTWIAAESDLTPTYTVAWRGRVRVGTITLRQPPGAGGSTQVMVEGEQGQTREGRPDAKGRLSFAPMNTDRLTVTFRRDGRLQPVQLTDLVIPGVRPLPNLRDFPLRLKCGFGPQVKLGGATVPTRAVGTVGDVLEGKPLRFAACGRGVNLREGANRLASAAFDPFRIETAVVGRAATGGRPQQAVRVTEWSSGSRKVEVEAERRSFLTVNENYNPGWKARVGGTALEPVRLDGWKQGWIVPAGTNGTVELAYGPDRAQRIAVVAGLNLLLVLLLVACLRGPGGGQRRPLPAGTGWPVWAALGLAVLLGLWVAGPVGGAVTAVVAGVTAWARTRTSRFARAVASPWPVAAFALVGTLCLAVGIRFGLVDNPAAPSGLVGDVVPQLLGAAVVARLAIELWRPRPRAAAEPIVISWRAPGDAPAAGTASPPGSNPPSPLRWSPPGAGADPSPPSPGPSGRSPRTRRR